MIKYPYKDILSNHFNRMSTITDIYDNQIISLDKILTKSVKDITFKELISLIFHSVEILSKDQLDANQKSWQKIYQEFESELKRQNDYKWPKITIIKNDNQKRIDVVAINKLYIRSDNFLTHLFRLVHIENYKRTYNYKSYSYHKILNYKLKSTNNSNVKSTSLTDIFILFESFMEYYMGIYNENNNKKNQKQFEYLLAELILKKFNGI